MMNSWAAFRQGLSHTVRYKWVLLILFAVNLASALVLVALPALLLLEPAHRPAIRQAADGIDAWLAAEIMMSPLANAAIQESIEPVLSDGMQQALLLTLGTLIILPLLAWLPANFLSGGVMLTFAEAPQVFRLRRFLWGCWHWFGAFLLLSVVQGIAMMVVFIPAIIIAIIIITAAGGWSAWVVIPLLIFLGLLWLAVVECTRIAAVIGQTQNIFRALGRVLSFIFRHFLAIAGLYGLALLLATLLHGLYHWGVRPYLPLSWWLLVLLVQQTFIITRLWARLARLAGATVLFQEKGQALN
jgi:hypothetical protein